MIRDGKAVLIDFERFAYGQPEWDVGMTATEYDTAGWWSPEQYRAFVDAYGFDVTQWSGFPTVEAVHQLKRDHVDHAEHRGIPGDRRRVRVQDAHHPRREAINLGAALKVPRHATALFIALIRCHRRNPSQ